MRYSYIIHCKNSHVLAWHVILVHPGGLVRKKCIDLGISPTEPLCCGSSKRTNQLPHLIFKQVPSTEVGQSSGGCIPQEPSPIRFVYGQPYWAVFKKGVFQSNVQQNSILLTYSAYSVMGAPCKIMHPDMPSLPLWIPLKTDQVK